MKFLVSMPAWGDVAPDMLIHTTLKSLLAGLKECPVDGELRFIVHTDRVDALRGTFRGLDVEWRRVPRSDCLYRTLGDCHRDALAAAQPGEVAVLLCADQVLSRETLRFCQLQIESGSRAIVCLGPRTLRQPDFRDVPIGADGKGLAAWSMAHAHPWTQACMFGEGNSGSLSTIYFRSAAGIYCHAFHLHPIAVVNDRSLHFARETIDNDLLDCFDEGEVYVVRGPDDFALAEVSPAQKLPTQYPELFHAGHVAAWAQRNASPRHRWLFRHRIDVVGAPVDDDRGERLVAYLDEQTQEAAP